MAWVWFFISKPCFGLDCFCIVDMAWFLKMVFLGFSVVFFIVVVSWFSSMMFLVFSIALWMWLWVGSPLMRLFWGYFDYFCIVDMA